MVAYTWWESKWKIYKIWTCMKKLNQNQTFAIYLNIYTLSTDLVFVRQFRFKYRIFDGDVTFLNGDHLCERLIGYAIGVDLPHGSTAQCWLAAREVGGVGDGSLQSVNRSLWSVIKHWLCIIYNSVILYITTITKQHLFSSKFKAVFWHYFSTNFLFNK